MTAVTRELIPVTIFPTTVSVVTAMCAPMISALQEWAAVIPIILSHAMIPFSVTVPIPAAAEPVSHTPVIPARCPRYAMREVTSVWDQDPPGGTVRGCTGKQ
jgi:hypothetical protein